MRIILPVLIWLILPNANAANSPRSIEECGALSQARMRECLASKERESETQLSAAQRASANAIAKWDEDPKFVARAQQGLEQSGAAFVKYREAQCELARSLGGGAVGNALELRRLACLYQLNTAQAKYLNDSTKRLPAK